MPDTSAQPYGSNGDVTTADDFASVFAAAAAAADQHKGEQRHHHHHLQQSSHSSQQHSQQQRPSPYGSNHEVNDHTGSPAHSGSQGGGGLPVSDDSLAAQAARYDPFKEDPRRDPRAAAAAAGAGGSTRSPFPSYQYPQGGNKSSNLGGQMPVFPGQSNAREIGQPVSAMRTQDGTDGSAAGPDGAVTPRGDGAEDDTNSYYQHGDHQEGEHHATNNDSSRVGNDAADASMASAMDPDQSQADTSSSNANAAGKKRKTYKYLQDDPVGQPSSTRAPGEKRKKVQKACRPCKRSHMPCQDQRPCPRCLKRGIPELCVDAEPLTRRPRKSEPSTSAQGTQANPSGEASTSAAAAGLSDISEIQQLAKAAEEAQSFGGQAGNSAYSKPIPTAADHLDQDSMNALRQALSKTEIDQVDLFAGVPLRVLADPTVQPQEDHSTAPGSALPLSWTRSYADLAQFALTSLSPSVADDLDSVMSNQRGQFYHLASQLQQQDLKLLEEETNNALATLRDNVLPEVSLPMMTLKRSGEIHAINGHGIETLGPAHMGKTNVIMLGHEVQALKIAQLLNTSTVVKPGKPVQTLVSLQAGGDDDETGAVAAVAAAAAASGNASGNTTTPSLHTTANKNYMMTMETKLSDGVGLPNTITCTLTPLEL